MSERLLQFTVPEDLYDAVDETSGFLVNVQNKLRTSLALGMFMFGEISLARAAELAEMPLAEFIDILEKLNILYGRLVHNKPIDVKIIYINPTMD